MGRMHFVKLTLAVSNVYFTLSVEYKWSGKIPVNAVPVAIMHLTEETIPTSIRRMQKCRLFIYDTLQLHFRTTTTTQVHHVNIAEYH